MFRKIIAERDSNLNRYCAELGFDRAWAPDLTDPSVNPQEDWPFIVKLKFPTDKRDAFKCTRSAQIKPNPDYTGPAPIPVPDYFAGVYGLAAAKPKSAAEIASAGLTRGGLSVQTVAEHQQNPLKEGVDYFEFVGSGQDVEEYLLANECEYPVGAVLDEIESRTPGAYSRELLVKWSGWPAAYNTFQVDGDVPNKKLIQIWDERYKPYRTPAVTDSPLSTTTSGSDESSNGSGDSPSSDDSRPPPLKSTARASKRSSSATAAAASAATKSSLRTSKSQTTPAKPAVVKPALPSSVTIRRTRTRTKIDIDSGADTDTENAPLPESTASVAAAAVPETPAPAPTTHRHSSRLSVKREKQETAAAADATEKTATEKEKATPNKKKNTLLSAAPKQITCPLCTEVIPRAKFDRHMIEHDWLAQEAKEYNEKHGTPASAPAASVESPVPVPVVVKPEPVDSPPLKRRTISRVISIGDCSMTDYYSSPEAKAAAPEIKIKTEPVSAGTEPDANTGPAAPDITFPMLIREETYVRKGYSDVTYTVPQRTSSQVSPLSAVNSLPPIKHTLTINALRDWFGIARRAAADMKTAPAASSPTQIRGQPTCSLVSLEPYSDSRPVQHALSFLRETIAYKSQVPIEIVHAILNRMIDSTTPLPVSVTICDYLMRYWNPVSALSSGGAVIELRAPIWLPTSDDRHRLIQAVQILNALGQTVVSALSTSAQRTAITNRVTKYSLFIQFVTAVLDADRRARLALDVSVSDERFSKTSLLLANVLTGCKSLPLLLSAHSTTSVQTWTDALQQMIAIFGSSDQSSLVASDALSVVRLELVRCGKELLEMSRF